jgi:hypothetical protein
VAALSADLGRGAGVFVLALMTTNIGSTISGCRSQGSRGFEGSSLLTLSSTKTERQNTSDIRGGDRTPRDPVDPWYATTPSPAISEGGPFAHWRHELSDAEGKKAASQIPTVGTLAATLLQGAVLPFLVWGIQTGRSPLCGEPEEFHRGEAA